ncbi:fimbria/pilus outer membrane usher protein [Escherichia coli]
MTDLNTASTGGDLDVTIKEEDGSEQRFTQPLPILPGYAAGQRRCL